MLIAFTSQAPAASTLHVTSSADDGGSGTLRNTIGAAVDGDTVVIDPGVNPTLTGQINIGLSITLEGQGAGATTVDGALLGRVFDVTGGTVTIRKLTVTGGKVLVGSGSGAGDGGGIQNLGANLTLDSVTISGNQAGNASGAAHAPPTSCTNSPSNNGPTAGRGGGVMNFSGTLNLINSTVSGNQAGKGAAGGNAGGSCPVGIGGSGGPAQPGGNGGGVGLNTGTVNVTGSTITGNHAGEGGTGGSGGTGPDGQGAGAPGGGGGYGGGISGATTVVNSTIEGNFAGASGAGGSGSPPGAGGGGLSAAGGIISGGTVINSTIAGNMASSAGGVADGTTLQNSLLVANTGGNCSATNITDGGHNLSFPVGGCPAGFAHGDPLLGSLAVNGGPTRTMALGAGSAALDQVPSSGSGCPATDQRLILRPQGSACDIGAFELEVAPVTPPAGTAPPSTGTAGTSPPSGPTGRRAAALKKCKNKHGTARAKCKRNANRLPA